MLTNDYYHFIIPTNAARAQFEINDPSGQMALVVSTSPPPPSLTSYNFLSANPSTNDQLIVVLTNSTPIPLTAGDWYVTAVRLASNSVTYSIMASWWPETGRPIIITNVAIHTNSFCITWTSLPGVHYYIQGEPGLRGSLWYTLSQTLTAGPADNTMTYCIALPSPFHFFRVVEGLALVDVPGPPPVLSVSRGTNGVRLQWLGNVTAQYQVQWTPTLSPPAWTTLATPVSSTTGVFNFLDNGTLTGGLGGTKFYRVIQVLY